MSEQDVFGLEVSMRVVETMHKVDGFQKLPREGLDHFEGIAKVIVFLDDVVEGGSEWLKHHAVILMMIESLNELDNMVPALRIRFVQGLHD